MKMIFILPLICLLFISLLVIFSPFQQGKIINQTLVEVTCEELYSYLGNSANASHWSVYVDSIEAINEVEYNDGEVGSKRVCFTTENRDEFNWEEEIVSLINNRYRKLICYNYKNLFINAPNLQTEQIYDQVNNTCKLSFTLALRESEKGVMNSIKLKLFGYHIANIFEQNLSNIKKLNEQ